MKKLVGFITSSLPNKNFTIDLAHKLKEAGVDTLELGVPFSDPVADGPVIEKASLEAIKQGFTLQELFDIASQITPTIDTVLMGYMNPFFHYGMEKFISKATQVGISGFIIPDLPYEETLRYKELFLKYDQALISFVAPTDSETRIQEIVSDAKKIYLYGRLYWDHRFRNGRRPTTFSSFHQKIYSDTCICWFWSKRKDC